MRLGFVSKMKMGNKMKKKGWGMEINGNKWMWKIEQKWMWKIGKKMGNQKKVMWKYIHQNKSQTS